LIEFFLDPAFTGRDFQVWGSFKSGKEDEVLGMIRQKLIGAFLGAFALAAPAGAATITFDIVGPSAVTAGSTAGFTVNYAVTDLPFTYTHSTGSATYSIDGVSLGVVGLSPAGGSFGFSYTFNDVKDYLVNVVGSMSFSNTTYEYLYSYTYSYRCGFFRCTGSSPVYGWVTRQVGTGSGSDSLVVSSVSPVPLPASALLMFGALGGLIAFRRRQAA
jgi:hypothetical protein